MKKILFSLIAASCLLGNFAFADNSHLTKWTITPQNIDTFVVGRPMHWMNVTSQDDQVVIANQSNETVLLVMRIDTAGYPGQTVSCNGEDMFDITPANPAICLLQKNQTAQWGYRSAVNEPQAMAGTFTLQRVQIQK